MRLGTRPPGFASPEDPSEARASVGGPPQGWTRPDRSFVQGWALLLAEARSMLLSALLALPVAVFNLVHGFLLELEVSSLGKVSTPVCSRLRLLAGSLMNDAVVTS